MGPFWAGSGGVHPHGGLHAFGLGFVPGPVYMPASQLLLLGFGAVLLSGQGIGKKGLQYKIHRRQCSLIAPFSAAGLRVFLRDDGLVSQIKRCRDACFKRPGP